MRSATHLNAIVRSVMVRLVTLENIRYITDDTPIVWVVLSLPGRKRSSGKGHSLINRTWRTWTSQPYTRVLDVDLARGMVKSEEFTRQDRYNIFLVVDVGHLNRLCVDIIGPILISHAWQSIAYKASRDARNVQVNKNRVNKRDCCACYSDILVSL